jgi:hypothetical protein
MADSHTDRSVPSAARGPWCGSARSRLRALIGALGLIVPLVFCQAAGAVMTYHGGPVMGTPFQPGENTTEVICWAPSRFSCSPANDSGYETAITTFLSDVAADSGHATNVYAAATQYTEQAGTVNGESYPSGRIAYLSHYDNNGPYLDTDPYPVPPLCTDTGHPLNTCVSAGNVAQELGSFINAYDCEDVQAIGLA